MQKKAILILGMHRSGTSAFARMLNLCGMNLPTDLSKPNEFNEPGYWESCLAQKINDDFLIDRNSAWFDPYDFMQEEIAEDESEVFIQVIVEFLQANFDSDGSVFFGIKDPRICRLAPFWKEALNRFGASVSIVIPFRNPLAVAASLANRDGILRHVAMHLWLRHILDAEYFSRNCDRVFVSYEKLLNDWQSQLLVINKKLGLDALIQTTEVVESVNAFLSESYQHHAYSKADLGDIEGCSGLVYRAYQLLLSEGDSDDTKTIEQFDQLRKELTDFENECLPDVAIHVTKFIKPVVHQVKKPEKIDQMRAERFALRESMSLIVRHKSEIESDLNSKETALKQLKEDLSNKLVSLKKASTDFAVLKKLVRDIQESNDEYKAEILRLEDQVWTIRDSFASTIDEILASQKVGQHLATQAADSAIKSQPLQHELNVTNAKLNSLSFLAGQYRRRFKQLMRAQVFGRKLRRRILESGIFDEEWYLHQYPDLRKTKNPLMHYLVNGAHECRNPGPYFDSRWYLEHNPDVRQLGANPLVHYLDWGWKEGRDPNPYFSINWYLDSNSDVRKQGINPLIHFVSSGDKLGLSPSEQFNSQWYLAKYQDVAGAKMPPYFHFITHGKKEGRLAREAVEATTTTSLKVNDTEIKFFLGGNALRRKAASATVRNARSNILLVAHTAGSRLFGAERSFLDICSSLDPAYFNVFAVVPMENSEYIKELVNVTDGVYAFSYLWWRKEVEVNPIATRIFSILLRKHRADLLYGNTIMLREPYLAARDMNVASVLHAREIIRGDSHLRDVIGLEGDQIIEAVTDRADFIIANSKATARSFKNTDKVRLLYNTIDGKKFTCLHNQLRHEIYVGMISSNIPKKGVRDFVKLARLAKQRLPQVKFRIIGPETEITRKLQKANGSDVNLEFCGYIETAEEAVDKLNIVVNFSSFAESFGRTIAEAMMAGRPVIVYDHGALPELVEHNETGFVIPFRDYKSALPYLEKMVNQPYLIKKLGEAGRLRALSLFDLPVFRSGLRKIVGDVLSSNEKQRIKLGLKGGLGTDKLRVAYFLWHFPVPSETFVLNELRYLVNHGHDVLVFCRQSPHKDFVPDFEITWQQVGTTDELAEHLVRTRRTLVHSHFVYPTVTEFLWPACEKANIEFTFIAHAQDIFRYENDKKNRIGEVARSKLCKRVLVPGRFHRNYLLSRGVPDDKIFINPQGIDPCLYPFMGDKFKPETRNVCCVQRFVEKKGILDLIQAAPILAEQNIKIDIYGYGPLEASYKSEIERLGVKNVKLCGAIGSRDELIEVIATSDLFVTPCIRAEDGDMDGIPTVFMEAMSVGTPVVTTGVSSIPDLISDGINGLICKEKNAKSVAETISRYYAMPESRKIAMRQEARKVIESQFSTDKLLSRLIDVYQQRTIDIVIVAWNNLPELKEVITRILKFTGMSYRLIITDNHSKKDAVDYLQRLETEHEQIEVLWQDRNLFVGPGTNTALNEGSSEYAIYICGKEGFALRHNWERELVEYMDSHMDVGLAGTLGYSPSYLTGKNYNSISVFSDFRNTGFAYNNPDRVFKHVQGGLFVIRRQMYEEIGGFSEAVPHDFTDVEYSFYVESCGWKLGQIPGVLALYNKSRPGIYSRLTEDIRAIHPPVLEDATKVERIANGEGALCPLCEWYGEQFEEQSGQLICQNCGSLPAHRSLWRFLAESTLTHRRLAGLYINPQKPLSDLWEKQFRGSMIDTEELSDILSGTGKLEFNNSRLDVIYVDDALESNNDRLLKEVHRVLSEGSALIVRQPYGGGERGGFGSIGEVRNHLEQCGFCNVRETSYSSKVVQYDWLPLLICEK
jgi:glycosyltransferase involved in cell wall biosynthesis